MSSEKDIQARLKRAEGQIRGVIKMMEEEKNCKDIVSQLAAVRSAVDKVMALIVAQNLEKCIIEEQKNQGDTRRLVEEAIELLLKSR